MISIGCTGKRPVLCIHNKVMQLMSDEKIVFNTQSWIMKNCGNVRVWINNIWPLDPGETLASNLNENMLDCGTYTTRFENDPPDPLSYIPTSGAGIEVGFQAIKLIAVMYTNTVSIHDNDLSLNNYLKTS